MSTVAQPTASTPTPSATAPSQPRSLAALGAALDALRSKLQSNDQEAAKEVGRLAQEALAHEVADVAGVVDFLSSAVRSARGEALAALLNNLGCVEKRRGQLKVALHHLERAADEEGGLEAAAPATLINLSATYSALLMFAEAAAVANHAVARCTSDFHRTRPLVRAAAYHNLATALEGSGELTFAAEAYEKALGILAESGFKGTPHHRTIERAAEQISLKLRNSRAHAEQDEWERRVRPGILRQSQAALRRTGELPPLKGAKPVPAITAGPAATTTPPLASRSPDRALVPHTNDTVDISSVYTASMRKFHALRSVALLADVQSHLSSTRKRAHRPNGVSPSPIAAAASPHRSGVAESSTALVTSDFHGTTAAGAVGISASGLIPLRSDPPMWNDDPVPHPHTLSHRVTPIPRNWDIERAVDERFIPRALVPLVEDIKYKEATRRRAIAKEWAQRLRVLRFAHRQQLIASHEDEERVAVEIEEVRVFRVLLQYIRGKLFFAEGSAVLGKQETQQREEATREAQAAWRALLPHSAQLQCLAEEECERYRFTKEDVEERLALAVQFETHAATVDCSAVVESSKHGICYALALWCIEGVVRSTESRQALEDKTMKRSLHVQERYALFGSHGK